VPDAIPAMVLVESVIVELVDDTGDETGTCWMVEDDDDGFVVVAVVVYEVDEGRLSGAMGVDDFASVCVEMGSWVWVETGGGAGLEVLYEILELVDVAGLRVVVGLIVKSFYVHQKLILALAKFQHLGNSGPNSTYCGIFNYLIWRDTEIRLETIQRAKIIYLNIIINPQTNMEFIRFVLRCPEKKRSGVRYVG